ncbi:hypothetical protein [Acidovorax sp. Root219]|uniref:hypothetical protein n=1 Tax=Acidovorax sp. Root219 TaxID=1736493 RepID=UPI000B0E9B44|nr:hypothetical protein [Acidovorax sp. Root219]
MNDYNATNDPALTKKADLLKRQGDGVVDYAYQKSAPLKPLTRQVPTPGRNSDSSKVFQGVGSREKAIC